MTSGGCWFNDVGNSGDAGALVNHTTPEAV